MAELNLTVMTPEKEAFSGDVVSFMLRTPQGDVGIMKNHVKYVSAVAIGKMKITTSEGSRYAAISKGFFKTDGNSATVLVDCFEWQEDIDLERAKLAEANAIDWLSKNDDPKGHYARKLQRAKTRIAVKNL